MLCRHAPLADLLAAAAREVGTSDQLELFRVFKEHDWHHVLTMAACLELLGNFALGGAIILPMRSCISGRELFFMDSLSFRDRPFLAVFSITRPRGGGRWGLLQASGAWEGFLGESSENLKYLLKKNLQN